MKKIKKLKDNKYLSTECVVHGNKQLSKILNKNEIVELNVKDLFVNAWVEHLEGCCQIFKIGNIVNVNLAFKNGTSAYFLKLPQRI